MERKSDYDKKCKWLIAMQKALNNIILCLISSSLDKSKRLVPLADLFFT